MTTTQLSIPTWANAVMVNGQKTALTEAASGGVGSKAEFPRISIAQGRWRLVDIEGEEQVLKTFEINFAVVSINPNVSKAWFEKKYNPGDEPSAPDCYSNNGLVPLPESDKIQSQQCATCDKNVWGSDANPNNGAKLKWCKDTKHISLMFLNPENLAAESPEIYNQRLSAMSMINFSDFAKEVAAAGGALDYIVIKAEFDEKADYPLIKFSVLRNMTQEEWTVVNRVRNEERAVRASNSGQKVIPIMAERIMHVPVRDNPMLPAPTGEMSEAQVTAAREQEAAKAKAETERMARVRAAQQADKEREADKQRQIARAAELAAAQQPSETPQQKKLREMREQLALLEAAEANDPSVGRDVTPAQNVHQITDVQEKPRQRHPVNTVSPDPATPDMEDLLSRAMAD